MIELKDTYDYFIDWCGDCITAEPIILEEMGNVPSNSIFVHVDIGRFKKFYFAAYLININQYADDSNRRKMGKLFSNNIVVEKRLMVSELTIEQFDIEKI